MLLLSGHFTLLLGSFEEMVHGARHEICALSTPDYGLSLLASARMAADGEQGTLLVVQLSEPNRQHWPLWHLELTDGHISKDERHGMTSVSFVSLSNLPIRKMVCL